MQLTKKTETEVLKIYDAWMHSYLHGDVETYNSFLDDDYHFIGSAKNEEFLNRKDTTKFFEDTGDQFAGKTEIRDETKTLEQFGELIFITHIFDGWFLNENDWTYYARFRFTSVLKNTQDGWRFIYQHFSIPDSKTEEGETIGYDKINDENQELREAITRRTFELEAQKRELEIEGALGRIRAQATAMKASTELLDIVVSMRNEFIKLGHEAHYFWHMMWLPNTYEKAMTSGDGTRIGFVMTLPRHIHGNIPLLANWEKSKDDTVVYAMNTEEAIDYVDKMVDLGDFQNIDPQAPSHDDIRHIGGLTFIMARTTHGEIGYSLPGIVKNPPQEDLQILERFADAFDLAHRRFLDLQKAEQQAREVEIELALERVRSRTMAMQHSDELQEASFLLDEQVRGLGIETWGCAFNIYGEKDSTEWFGNEAGVLPTYSVPRIGIFKKYYDKGQKGETLWIEEFSGKACVAHYETMSALPVIGDVLLQLKETNNGFPTYQIDHVVFFKYGYLLFITKEHVPESYDIFKRFAKVFEQTYTRFLDLQKAEAQARESQIELGLERVRARAMAMQNTNELSDLVGNLLHELTKLDFSLTFCIINIINEADNSNTVWAANPKEGKAPESYYMKFEDYPFHHAMMREWKAQTPKFIYVMEGEEKEIYDDYLYTDTEFRRFPKEVQTANRALDKYVASFVFSKFGGLQTVGDQPLSDESLDILYRFGKVFDLTYTRFNDLQKAEEQARDAKVEAAMERIRSRSLAMTKSEQLSDVILEIHKKFKELDISMESRVAIVVVLDSNSKSFKQYVASNNLSNIYISTPYFEHIILDDFYAAKEAGVEFFSKAYTEEEKNSYFKQFFETSNIDDIPGIEDQKQWVFEQKFYTHSQAFQKNSCIGMADYSGIPLNDFEIDTIKRFSKVFDQAYTRFLDLKKAEAQAREAQIEAALERVRSRSMAMHNSDEIGDVAFVLFQQLKSLGGEFWGTGFGFCEKNSKVDEFWFANENGIMPQLKVPNTKDTAHKEMYKGWTNNLDLLSIEKGGKALERHYDYMLTVPDVQPIFQGMLDDGLAFPKWQKWHAAYFKYGYLLAITTEAFENEDILKRFAKVFEQAYTRFLDLQKAEAQAREAQIETALERVRASAMAMHKSDDLTKAVDTVFSELKQLKFNTVRCGIGIFNDQSNKVNVWTASSNNKQETSHLSGDEKLEGHPLLEGIYKAWKKQVDFSYTLENKDLESYYQVVSNSNLPVTAPNSQQNLSTQYYHVVNFPAGGLFAFSDTEFSQDKKTLMKRFGEVFHLSFIRHLDLKQAENQAREAQIVASLERVRAATMAMHQSKELSNVLSTLFGQYDILGINPSHAVLTLINKEKNTLTFRTTGKNGYEVYAEQEVDLNLYDSWIDTTEKWKKSNPNAVNVNEYPPEVLPDVWEVYKDVVNAIPKKARPEVKDFPEGLFITEGYCQFGYIGFAHSRQPTEEEKDIVRRFAVEFGSLYQRFLDLQKAEAQAREAQIEVALEKIRSRTMAMQKGEELKDIVVLLYKELIALGVTNFTSCGYVEVNEETERQLTYVTGQGGDSLGLFYLPMQGDDVFDERYAAWKNQQAVFHQTVAGKERKKHLEYAITTFNSKEAEEMVLTQFPDPTVFYCFNFSHGYLHIVGGSRLTTEEEALMARFTRVFEQTYARFLDLKKAEIQTREAQINLAVERVRAKALAMHKSEEIMEVVAKLKEEVMGLDIPGVVAATIFLEADNNYIRMWDLSALERSDKGYLAITDITFKLKKKDPHLYIKRVWETNENYFVETQDTNDLDRIIEFMYENNQLEIAKEVEDYTKSTNLQQLYHASKRLNNGKLCIDLLEPPPAEMEAILDKIGAAFDLAYQRFLDLQKAEAQTKESQIEAALEKVRSRSLAMQKPDELQEVVAIVAEKLKELGVIFDAGGVILCTYFPDNKDVVHWIAVPDFSSSGRYYVPYFDNPIFNDAWESKIRGDAYFSKEFPVEVKNHFFEHTFKHSDYRVMPEDYKQHVLKAESHALSAAWSKNSAILIPSLTGVVPSENDAKIIQRFAKVFEQAYVRFMDLQQAEIREKEAIKQASLDRVRGEIASMRTTKDLERITPLIWKELTTLGVPFFRCGVFIIREDEKMVHAYLSKPDGTSVAALHIPFSDTDNKLITPTIENWRLQQVYKETWNQDQFIQQTHLFMEKGQIENPEAYDISETPPEQLVLHLIPFKQGMVYVGNHENLTEDQISLVESLSIAFSVAYSRYEDFKALETAKNSLELTINDLKSAQAQLIQAEKMASLGELTAGIAHEIQNPLNFVNNFSEVSEELVDEMNEELDNGDIEEAKAISKDLKDNLGKINHHGKRADAIVKGMLEHSRINKGEKKPTDINALLDEFVRLSYHGLRAKDKSFNVDFKLKLDPDLPKVNVVSSDIGRVILNLVNNAFYACAECSRSAADKNVASEINIYKPEVIVSSKQTEHSIELSVKDNGGGIPEQVRDKIFQPFFTTKPTGKGTGLGLSLSYDIIKAHGGKLTLESSEGEGTLFSIKLPIQ